MRLVVDASRLGVNLAICPQDFIHVTENIETFLYFIFDKILKRFSLLLSLSAYLTHVKYRQDENGL